jgi:hypothetical protein
LAVIVVDSFAINVPIATTGSAQGWAATTDVVTSTAGGGAFAGLEFGVLDSRSQPSKLIVSAASSAI